MPHYVGDLKGDPNLENYPCMGFSLRVSEALGSGGFGPLGYEGRGGF